MNVLPKYSVLPLFSISTYLQNAILVYGSKFVCRGINMRDTITMGTIAGFISTTVMTIIVWIVRLLGYEFITTWETATHIFLTKKLIHTPIGYLTGFLGQFSLGAIYGVIVAYTLRFTGKDFYILKGIGVGAVVWLASIGFFMHLLGIQIEGRGDPLSNLMAIIEFIILGIINSYVVKKYARFPVR